jgi:phytoene dehydrogenase-like protein
MKIVIIGAGVSGSVLSDLLTKQNHEVTIIERSKIPGGMCKSYYKDGFTYEYGPHILATHHSSQRTKEKLK